MRKQLTASQILQSADHRERGIRRWDISNEVSLFHSAYEDWYDQKMLWANEWCIHVHWKAKESPWVPIRISRESAWDLLITKYGVWQ